MSDEASLAGELRRLLRQAPILARRLVLDTGGTPTAVPVLRGIWGRALHGLDPAVYQSVFHPADHQQLPGYVLRPAGEAEPDLMALEWISLGQAVEHDETLLRAWDVAAGMGIGAARTPFSIYGRASLQPDGGRTETACRWSLAQAAWPIQESIEPTGCRISFCLPVSLLRDHRLITAPTLKDVVVRTCRRIGAFLPAASRTEWDQLRGKAIALAGEVPFHSDWQEPIVLRRYSAAQQRDFAVPGVCGRLDLPQGPSALWPLFAALAWTHVGKACNLGLGQIRLEIL